MKFSIVKNSSLVPLKIEGRDRERYLQGRITQDIKKLEGSESRQSFILSPQGKIEGKFSFSSFGEAYLMLVELDGSKEKADSLQTFLSSLFRFKVADDISATDISSEFRVYTLFSDEKFEISSQPLDEQAELIIRVLQRGSLFTADILVPITLSEDDLLGVLKSKFNVDAKIELFDTYDSKRIKAGYPLVGKDILENTLGPDLPLDSYVSFKKGCYAGQEVIEMSIARGRPNRALVKIELDGALPESFDGKFYDKSLENSIGTLSSISFDQKENKTSALGYIKTKYEPVETGYLKDSPLVFSICRCG